MNENENRMDAVMADALARQKQTVNGLKVICNAVAEVDTKAAIHMAVEGGMRAAAAQNEAVQIIGAYVGADD